MNDITPYQFFETLFREPLRYGQLMVWSQIRHSGKTMTDWCYSLHQAGRRVERYRHHREVLFGVALRDRQQALRRARQRNRRATPTRVLGSAETVTALPALWAEIGVVNAPWGAGGDEYSAERPSPDRPAARAGSGLPLIGALSPAPSMVVWTGTAYQVYWLLAKTWVLESRNDHRRAQQLLAKVGWALENAAAAEGWRLDSSYPPQPPRGRDSCPPQPPWGRCGCDLAGMMQVAGTFHHLAPTSQAAVPVVVERRPGDRWDVSDFEGLEDPPQGHRADPIESPQLAQAEGPIDLGPEGRGGGLPEEPAPPADEGTGTALSEPVEEAAPEPRIAAEGLEIQVVFRLGPGDDVPPSWSPLVEAATACLEGSAAAESSGGEPDASTAHPQRKDHRPCPSRRLVDGLEELIAALGGPATARQMLEALAAEENQARFEGLRSALRQLFPDAEGGLPTARQLGYALRSYRRGAAGEKAVVATGEVKQGKTWAVRQTPGGCDSDQGDTDPGHAS